MQRLWSPWRSEYVGGGSSEGCIFCRFAGESRDAENLVLLRASTTFVVLNRFPYNSGHLMIVPYEHTSEFPALSAQVTGEMMELLSTTLGVFGEVYRPDGCNAGMNLGSAAGAGIADHLHLHVIPRWVGDTNFMASVGDVKVMPERLQDSYQKLAAALQARWHS